MSHRHLAHKTVALALLAPATAPTGYGQCESSVQEFRGFNSQAGDEFGRDVAVDGSWMAVGAPGASGGGSVYVYQLGTLIVETEIPAPYATCVEFGDCVDISGRRMAIGDPGYVSNRGRIHLYEESGGTWTHMAAIIGPSPAGCFGTSISIDGDTVAVGAPEENNIGSVHVYQRDSAGAWSLHDTLTPSNGSIGDEFGRSVSVWSTYPARYPTGALAIGAPLHSSDGAIYVYRLGSTQWDFVQTMAAPTSTSNVFFGWSVHTDGTRLVAGAPGDDDMGASSGSALVYRDSGTSWAWEQTLLPSNPDTVYFGVGVALAGDVCLVGAPWSSIDGMLLAGEAYQFRDVGIWVEQARVVGAAPSSYAGHSVDTDGSNILLGGPYSSTGDAYRRQVQDLDLDVDPDSAALGAVLEVSTCGGVPSSLVGLFLVAWNGTPIWQAVMFGSIDSAGMWLLSTRYTDPALSGLDFDLVTLTFNAAGQTVMSNQENLALN